MVIFDIDNCISDDGWRLGLIRTYAATKFAKYHHYHLASAFDRLVNKDTLAFHKEAPIFFITAMPEHYRMLRTIWLNRNGVSYAGMLMRPDHDHRDSVLVKADLLAKLTKGGGSVSRAYDDRPDVLEMYKHHGVQEAIELRAHSLEYPL